MMAPPAQPGPERENRTRRGRGKPSASGACVTSHGRDAALYSSRASLWLIAERRNGRFRNKWKNNPPGTSATSRTRGGWRARRGPLWPYPVPVLDSLPEERDLGAREMSLGARRSRRTVTLWPDSDGLSVAPGGPGGPRIGGKEAELAGLVRTSGNL